MLWCLYSQDGAVCPFKLTENPKYSYVFSLARAEKRGITFLLCDMSHEARQQHREAENIMKSNVLWKKGKLYIFCVNFGEFLQTKIKHHIFAVAFG